METEKNFSSIKTISPDDPVIIESIDFFVRMMSILGLPRSVGEIYGLLYFSKDPTPMDQIAGKLGISIGSASQGLKTLRNLKAIKTAYVPGNRKDHFVAETEFRRLFSNFIKDEILPHLFPGYVFTKLLIMCILITPFMLTVELVAWSVTVE